MHYQYIPYIWPLLISGIISFTLGVFSLLRRRSSKGTISFAISMFIVTLWAIPNALEMSAIDLGTKLFWANVQYIAYCYSPVVLLVLCMQFTGSEKSAGSRKLLLLLLIPSIILLLVWTDGYHGLIRYDIQLDSRGPFPVIMKEYGIAFYVHALYSHILNFTTLFLLFRAAYRRKTIYRKQVIALLTGVGLIVVPNLLYILKLSPLKYDITPAFFGPAGLIMFWNIFRYKMFDLVPLAWATVIETMETAIIVLDLQDRVIETNPALKKWFGIEREQILHKQTQNIGSSYPELAEALNKKGIPQTEFSIQTEAGLNTYEILFTPLINHKGVLLGRLAAIYEITEKKKNQQEYIKQQWRQAIIEEKERSSRDMHDNLGQVLGFINLQAQAIRHEYSLQHNDELLKQIDRLVSATKEAHKEVREYINDARGYVYLENGFIAGLNNIMASFQNSTGIQVISRLPEDCVSDEIDPNIRINILNIIREGLNNVRKHSQASQVSIMLDRGIDQFIVVIEDNGIGFDNNDKKNNQMKFGLNIMKERASEIGARLNIKSAMGAGCRIELLIPMWEGEKPDVNVNESDAG